MNRRRPHLNGLTSLRFIAAITIFILHARNHDLIPDSFLSSFDLSKSVSLFFVLSGCGSNSLQTSDVGKCRVSKCCSISGQLKNVSTTTSSNGVDGGHITITSLNRVGFSTSGDAVAKIRVGNSDSVSSSTSSNNNFSVGLICEIDCCCSSCQRRSIDCESRAISNGVGVQCQTKCTGCTNCLEGFNSRNLGNIRSNNRITASGEFDLVTGAGTTSNGADRGVKFVSLCNNCQDFGVSEASMVCLVSASRLTVRSVVKPAPAITLSTAVDQRR